MVNFFLAKYNTILCIPAFSNSPIISQKCSKIISYGQFLTLYLILTSITVLGLGVWGNLRGGGRVQSIILPLFTFFSRGCCARICQKTAYHRAVEQEQDPFWSRAKPLLILIAILLFLFLLGALIFLFAFPGARTLKNR